MTAQLITSRDLREARIVSLQTFRNVRGEVPLEEILSLANLAVVELAHEFHGDRGAGWATFMKRFLRPRLIDKLRQSTKFRCPVFYVMREAEPLDDEPNLPAECVPQDELAMRRRTLLRLRVEICKLPELQRRAVWRFLSLGGERAKNGDGDAGKALGCNKGYASRLLSAAIATLREEMPAEEWAA